MELWHEQLGHPGVDSTKAVLGGGYGSGITWNQKCRHTKCIACILGKVLQAPYSHHGHRASELLALIHVDICGPFLVQGVHSERYFIIALDDCSNDGAVECICSRDQAYHFFTTVEARWERQTGKCVKAVRMDGAKELCQGDLGNYLERKGILIQQPAAYAHQQNGKAERFVCTIEDSSCTLIASSDLPASFWPFAVYTTAYLRWRLPTSTLPKGKTAYEAMTGVKPSYDSLRVWGCHVYPLDPTETWGKGENMRYKAIFVRYEENRVGWGCVDLNGKYRFTNDVVFDELAKGRLGNKRKGSVVPVTVPADSAPSSLCRSNRVPIPTPKGAQYRDEIQQKQDKVLQLRTSDPSKSDPLPPPVDFVADYAALAYAEGVLSEFVDEDPTLADVEACAPSPIVAFATLHVDDSIPDRARDMSHPPASYKLTRQRPDWLKWKAAMGQEKSSLEEKHVFERVPALPPGRKAIPLMWVYDLKNGPGGDTLEKARVVVLGNRQGSLDFGDTFRRLCEPQAFELFWPMLHPENGSYSLST